jgi:hypothetical protein
MSAASTPAPARTSTVSGSRHTLFWPVLILMIGMGIFALYQVMSLNDQLDEVTQAVDQMDGKVKRAQYEKGKFFSIVRDVLVLAPNDPNADQLAVQLKLKQLQEAHPELLSQAPLPGGATTNTPPTAPKPASSSK